MKHQTTHYCCDYRLKRHGGKATCCWCDPHEGCDEKREPVVNSRDFTDEGGADIKDVINKL